MSTTAPALYVRKVRGMGRGVFAGRAYRKGEVIEVCPVIRLPAASEGAAGGGLEHYVSQWGEGGPELAIALGYGSLYNHSSDPNAEFTPRASRDDIVFRALQDIAAGEQVFIDSRSEETDYATFREGA